MEQDLAYARLLAGLHGVRARRNVAELVGFLVEAGAGLPLPEDKLTTIMEAAQVSDVVCYHGSSLVPASLITRCAGDGPGGLHTQADPIAVAGGRVLAQLRPTQPGYAAGAPLPKRCTSRSV